MTRGGPTLGCTGGTLNFYSIIIILLSFPHVDEHVTNKSSFFFYYFLGFIIYICSRDFSWVCYFEASGPDCFCSMYGLLIFNTANRRNIMDMGALISPYETKKCENISKCIIVFIYKHILTTLFHCNLLLSFRLSMWLVPSCLCH